MKQMFDYPQRGFFHFYVKNPLWGVVLFRRGCYFCRVKSLSIKTEPRCDNSGSNI